jgi:hypothetical protein
MSTQLILLATGGTVKVDGNPLGGWVDFDQLEDKSVKIQLVGNASCELHRRIAVRQGAAPGKGNKSSLCLKLHAQNGVFDLVRVRARPKLRKNGTETDPSMHKHKRELKLKNQRTQLTYHIKTKGLLGFPVKKLKLTFDAKV